MGSKKTKTKSQETATTTPNIYPGGQGALDTYFGGVDNFLKTPAQNYVTPINPLQQMVFDRAGSMGDPRVAFLPSENTLYKAQGAIDSVQPVSLPSQYTPATTGNVGYGQVMGADVAATPTAVQAAVAQTPGAVGVDTSFLDNASAKSYGGAKIAPLIDQFQNPYRQQVVDATLADLTQKQAEDRAGFARQGAANNAFGGSGYRIGQAELIDAQGRTRATTQASLLADMYQRALDAAGQQAGLYNQAGIASMESGNAFEASKLGNRTQANVATANNANDMARAGFEAQNTANLANAGAQNQFGLAGFDARNTANLANAGAYNSMLQNVFGERNANARADMAAQNDALSQFYNAAVNNGQFNANLGLDKANAYSDIGMSQAQLAQMAQEQQLAQLGLQGDLGNALWNYQNQATQAPLTQLAAGSDLLSLLPQVSGQTINTSGTSTSKQSGGLGGALIGALGQIGAAAVKSSERRVKRDIVKLGEEPDGLGVYQFRYLWDSNDEPLRYGTMVDEVERLRPWALGPVVDGIRTVDYSRL